MTNAMAELRSAVDAKLPGFLPDDGATPEQKTRAASLIARAADDYKQSASGAGLSTSECVTAVLGASEKEADAGTIARAAREFMEAEAKAGRTVSTAQAVGHIVEQAKQK